MLKAFTRPSQLDLFIPMTSGKNTKFIGKGQTLIKQTTYSIEQNGTLKDTVIQILF